MTDKEHDLTIVTCEDLPPDITPLTMDTSRAYGGSFKAGRTVYILGHERKGEQTDPVVVGRGKVMAPHSDDKVIKFLVKEQKFYSPGSAGFDSWGNFSFVVCSPQGWLPENSKAKKRRFSLMTNNRREKLPQTGLTIHSIKEWMQTLLSDRLQGKNDPDSSVAGPGAIAQDMQGFKSIVDVL